MNKIPPRFQYHCGTMPRKSFYDTRAGADEEFDDDRPSKSQRKRDCDAMQALGKELTQLTAEQVGQIPLPEETARAIQDFALMRSFGAQRRQLQLIGKLMRNLDAAAVREAIDRATGESRAAAAAHKRAERAREELIAKDEFLTVYAQKHPEIELQRLRQLIRQARKEAEKSAPPKAFREIYRLLYAIELPTLTLEAVEVKDDDE